MSLHSHHGMRVWCIACHSTNTTLRNIGGEAKMCVECIKRLREYGAVNVIGGGRFQIKDGNMIYVPQYIPAETPEVNQ